MSNTELKVIRKSKNSLNSRYGLSAQNPIKPEDYAWRGWFAAWGRLRLEEKIRLGGSRFVYADTDSVKYLG